MSLDPSGGNEIEDAAPSTGLSLKAAFGNLIALARAVQADAKAHELIRESLEVVGKACGLDQVS